MKNKEKPVVLSGKFTAARFALFAAVLRFISLVRSMDGFLEPTDTGEPVWKNVFGNKTVAQEKLCSVQW